MLALFRRDTSDGVGTELYVVDLRDDGEWLLVTLAVGLLRSRWEGHRYPVGYWTNGVTFAPRVA